MLIEYPLKYANILLMKLFWVTGKEAIYMAEGIDLKYMYKSLERKEHYCNKIYFSRLKYVNFYCTTYIL